VTHDAEAAADDSVRTVALVGLGVIGQVHLRTLAEVPELEVGCVVDPRAEAREPARRAGLPSYDDVDALLRDVDRGRLPAPELYVVATPTNTHVGLAERLLATTAADVLSEKPLADDPAALEVLAARPDVHDRLRVVNHFAFSPEVVGGARRAHDRGWGPPTSVLSVFNDPYVLKPEHERATYVSSWTDSGPNQLGLLARFVSGVAVAAHDAVADGTRSVTRVVFDGGTGVLTSSWHTGDSSKQTSLRWSGGRELWLDHTSMTAVAVEDGTPVAHLGHDGTVDRKRAHYRAMYRTYVDDPAHPLLSLGSARETVRLLREAHELASPPSEQAWESWSAAP
jgi:predicted dehydrogenase